MAPGPQLTLAFSLIRGFPPVLEDVTTMLNKELDSARDKLILPVDLSRWSSVLSSRSKGRFDTLATVTVQEVTLLRATLDELYPGEHELPTRLDAVFGAMQTSFGESNTLWQQFKMSYDNNVLHLDTSERESMEKAFPDLERRCEDIRRRVAAAKTAFARWRPCFDLVLTEEGRLGYHNVLDERRAWTRETFPDRVTVVVNSLQQLADARADLVLQSTELWDKYLDAWIGRSTSGNRLPTSELCAATAQYLAICQALAEQTEQQKALLDELKSITKQAHIYGSTLSAAQGAPISIEDIRNSFDRYESIWIESMKLSEMCNTVKATLQDRMTILEGARARA
ncbi:hypothetical protein C8Q76DRAFT_789327 [Earliella scabrosa]|nr:hypothetical protein C8Q76DRAFT_802181 [Earliella scabrosa]KAI0744852.1 hypothetical protein C8Q76DRAFT_789327 [Earliella scabrosa]